MTAGLRQFWSVIDSIACYYTVNLGRGVFFSFALLTVVMLFRRLAPFRGCFWRLVLWSPFFLLPYIGGLKLFYETKFGVRGFFWWANLNYSHTWIGRIYFLVMAFYGGFLFYRERKLLRSVRQLENQRDNVYLCERTVTPFAVGLFSPKIVVPRMMTERCSAEELETILFHERMHIRLGHLWLLFFWDVLRVLFWPNFWMTLCMKELKADLEEICDRVTVQRGERDACRYGLLLLKCMGLLQEKGEGMDPAPALSFVGDRGRNSYIQIRRRIMRIADFRRYRAANVIGVLFLEILLLAGGFWGIHRNSYARYTNLENVSVFDDTGVRVILEDSERLRRAVTFDEQKVSIETKAFGEMLAESGSSTEGVYILFGGFMKQPGVGGGGNMVYADLAELTGDKAEIAYDGKRDALTWVFMNM